MILDVRRIADEDLRRLIDMALYTGQRGGDLIKMLWSQYDGEGIQVVQGKTGARVWIPAHRDLQALLAEIPRNAAVILTRNGRPWASHNYIRRVHAAVTKAGFSGYSLHGLRRNATTRLLEAGCTTDEVKSITGHATTAMVELYGRDVNQRRMARSAVAKLEHWKNEK